MRLTTLQWQRVSACILALHALPYDERFVAGVLEALCALIGAEYGLYGITDILSRKVLLGLRWPDAMPPKAELIFEAHFADHPFSVRNESMAAQHAAFCIGAMAGREWTRTALVNELFAPQGVTRQLLVPLAAPDGYVEALGVARQQPEFSTLERFTLGCIAPHVKLVWTKYLASAHCASDEAYAELRLDTRDRVVGANAHGEAVLQSFERQPGDRCTTELFRFTQRGHKQRRIPLFVGDAGYYLGARLDEGGETVLRFVKRPLGLGPVDSRHGAFEPAAFSARSTQTTLPPTRTARLGLPTRLGEVAELMTHGLTDKEMAERSGLSVATIRTYVTRIYERVGVHSRVELINRCLPNIRQVDDENAHDVSNC